MKITVLCRKDVVYKNGTSPLFLRFAHQRKSKYISLGVTIPSDYWDSEAQMITSNHPERVMLQSKIDAVVAGYMKQIQRMEALDIEVTLDNLFGDKVRYINCTLDDYFQGAIDRLKSLEKCGTHIKYKTTLSSLRKCADTSVRLSQIDLTYLLNLETELRKSGCSSNSIATRFSVFKAVYNKALSEGLFSVKVNPFERYSVGSLWTQTRKRSLLKEDVIRIIRLEIPEVHKTEYRRLAKDIFLFSYFTGGTNFSDIATLRYSNLINGRMYYCRRKTKKEISCQLNRHAQDIIGKYSSKEHTADDYVFPILCKNKHITDTQIFDRIHKALVKVNRELKAIGRELELPIVLTTYVARHTFATVLKRSGVNVAIISEALGHSDLSTTQIYLDSFGNSQIDEAMKYLA